MLAVTETQLPSPDAPVELRTLLLPDEEAQLLASSRDLCCPVCILDPRGPRTPAGPWSTDGHGVVVILGDTPPESVLRAEPEAEPLLLSTERGAYLCAALFHDGDRLAHIVAGPIPGHAAAPDAALALPRHLCWVAEMMLLSGLRRVLSSRVHVASVEDAYCELQVKNQRLEQAVSRMQELDRIKSNFLATVSHELRTPLTSVIGYSEMLMEGLAGPLNDEQREYLRTIMDKGEQLLGLITGILDISRIESAGVQLFPAPLCLRDVLTEVVTTVTPQARRKHVALSTSVPGDMPLIQGDRDKLRQVLLNLVGNAIKFTPDGGQVSITAVLLGSGDHPLPSALAGPAALYLGPADPGDQVRISVADSGIGIPPHLHQKVFDPFFQVDNSSTREYEGTGLGLSIVRKFVEAHGGRVWIESAQRSKAPSMDESAQRSEAARMEDVTPRGVIFHFTLPVVAAVAV